MGVELGSELGIADKEDGAIDGFNEGAALGRKEGENEGSIFGMPLGSIDAEGTSD